MTYWIVMVDTENGHYEYLFDNKRDAQTAEDMLYSLRDQKVIRYGLDKL